MAEYIEIEKEDLDRILENHKHYLNEDCENWKSMRADLSDINLAGIDLSGINLFDADLDGANLEGTNLRNAVLSYANLSGTNLKDANLINANLSYANLMFSNLCNTDLSYADLKYANLAGSVLSSTNLFCTNLAGVNLYHTTITNQPKIKGEILTQDIIGYKKCKDNTIVTLKIPRGAIIFCINGIKCRTNKAIVLDIEDMNGNKVDRAVSAFKYMSYYVGDEITDYTFNCQYNVECSGGIHFFRTKKLAKYYKYI